MIVTRFPFVLATLKNLTVNMPWLNTKTQLIEWESISDCYWDDDAGHDNLQGVLAQYLWLNKLNPDWQRSFQYNKYEIPNVTGENTFKLSSTQEIDVEITGGASKVDLWWNSTLIGRFGAYQFAASPMPNPLMGATTQFCNTLRNQIHVPQPCPAYFYLNLPKGVTAKITLYQNSSQTEVGRQTPPPVWFTCEGNLSWQPFVSDAGPPGPNALYGP